MKTSFLSAFLALLFFAALPGNLHADVNAFSIFKVANYTQTDATQPLAVADPDAYYFGSQLGADTNTFYGGTNDTMVTNAFFFTPDGQQFFMDTADQMYYFYGSPFFTNQAGLDAAFISGDYEFQVNDAGDSGTLFVPSNSLYSADIPYFTGNTWSNMQALDPFQPFTLTFNNFHPNPGATEAFIFLRIFDDTGFSPYDPGFITPGTLTNTIPAGTLAPDTAYTIQIFFSDRTNEPATGFGGTSGVVGYDNLTTTTLVTLPQPRPTLNIALAGTNYILSWPATAASFNLQATAQIPPTAGWFFMSNSAVVIGNQLVLTNPVTSQPQFFRLQEFGE